MDLITTVSLIGKRGVVVGVVAVAVADKACCSSACYERYGAVSVVLADRAFRAIPLPSHAYLKCKHS